MKYHYALGLIELPTILIEKILEKVLYILGHSGNSTSSQRIMVGVK